MLETQMHNYQKAVKFATEAHGDQMYGDKPYIYHLKHVDQVACRFGLHDNETVRVGCLLHDVVEDTDKTLEEIEYYFGADIAFNVDLVTDIEGKDKEFLFKTKTSKSILATIVKLCDRIANVEACIAENKVNLLKKYVHERELFEHLKVFYDDSSVLRALFLYFDEIMSIAQLRIDDEIERENGN